MKQIKILVAVVAMSAIGCASTPPDGETATPSSDSAVTTDFGESVASSVRSDNGDIHTRLMDADQKVLRASLEWSAATSTGLVTVLDPGTQFPVDRNTFDTANPSLEAANRAVRGALQGAQVIKKSDAVPYATCCGECGGLCGGSGWCTLGCCVMCSVNEL